MRQPLYFRLFLSILYALSGVEGVFSAESAPDRFLRYRQLSVEWPLKELDVRNAAAETEPQMKPYTEIIPETEPGTEVRFDMVPIPSGRFMMGSSPQEQQTFGGERYGEADVYDPASEGPQHEVEIAPFWMGRCEVTWDEFCRWSEAPSPGVRCQSSRTPSVNQEYADAILSRASEYFDQTFGMGKRGYPVIRATSYAARMYCKWLTATTGRYYRLPTEAEWEYACRAGTTTVYSWGNESAKMDEYAWYYDNVDESYAQVGKKRPNPWGLYDMHGNVWEMCLDKYESDSYAKLVEKAQGKTVSNPLVYTDRFDCRIVVRGGSWDDDPDRLRSAARWASDKSWNASDPVRPKSIWFFSDAPTVGFRVVRPLHKPTADQARLYEPDGRIIEEYYQPRHDDSPGSTSNVGGSTP